MTVFFLHKWEILRDPFSTLALYSVALVVAPIFGFLLCAHGFLDPLIGLVYTIPEPWHGRGVTSMVSALLSTQVVVISFIMHAFKEEPELDKKNKKRTKKTQ
mmetsp:Transcript_36644/g.93673  ORF Transcript_36644/g.93673 Transcript_36644/m.93673 type:complete len:102 (-) Transcript_36644:1255-1560(-)|eukprot:jgi/Tetstr1/456881/TSEL_043553.t1